MHKGFLWVTVATLAATLALAQSDDRSFLKAASQGNLGEIELAKLAQQKAASSSVKQFAARMITDHTKMEDQVLSAASRWGVVLPAGGGDASRSEVQDLSSKSGSAFDRAYMALMVKDHRDGAAAYDKEAKDGDNPAFRDLAGQNEPTVQAHLRLAEDTAKKVGGQ